MELFTQLPVPAQILIGFIILLTLWFHGPAYSAVVSRNAPAILTNMGIFGTFLGIAIGLMAFDSSEIEASVPPLIDGLKAAFWSSIVGLFGALTIKLRQTLTLIHKARIDTPQQSANIEDLLVSLRALGTDIKEMKLENTQKLGQLVESNQQFQAKVVSANTDAFVTALSTVMSEFNSKIDIQYGDNFKQLNTAVGTMLEWQKAFSGQLAGLLESQKLSSSALEKASSSYGEMIEHTRAFNQVAESLGELLKGLELQTRDLDSHLSGLSDLVGTASKGLPALGDYVSALTDKLSDSIEENNKALSLILAQTSADIGATVKSVTEGLAESVNEAHQGLASHIQTMTEKTNEQAQILDKAMEKELTRALQTFGYQLTALSEKFVNDYVPLTDKLREVIELVEEAK